MHGRTRKRQNSKRCVFVMNRSRLLDFDLVANSPYRVSCVVCRVSLDVTLSAICIQEYIPGSGSGEKRGGSTIAVVSLVIEIQGDETK
jgi:hypothetical protein